MTNWTQIIDRLHELKNGAVDLPDGERRQLTQETLRDLDRFFREKILYTDELNEYERGVVIEHYLLTATKTLRETPTVPPLLKRSAQEYYIQTL